MVSKNVITLSKSREKYEPKLPLVFSDFTQLIAKIADNSEGLPEIKTLFPHTFGAPFLSFEKGNGKTHKPLKVGVVLSGGQAAGGHNVITGLYDALKKLNNESQLFGFLNGPIGIIKNKYIELNQTNLLPFRNQGGFDLLGSGRDKIETPEQFLSAAETLRTFDGLVVIGGDDSNTNAALLAEYFKENKVKTTVVGVPKTIDGDLKNEHIEISFGFDSAVKTYSEIIGNLMRDSLSAKKYTFFIKLMGRSASHIALECALQTHPNLTLIGEEKKSLIQLTHEIADVIEARSKNGKNYGVILIPEGVVEFVPELKTLIQELNRGIKPENLTPESKTCFEAIPQSIQSQLLLDRDPHGNVQVSKIETERLFIEMVERELKKRNVTKFSPQPLFCGYEGRSCLPSNFDSNYCYALGFGAALLIDNQATGYIAGFTHLAEPVEKWKFTGVPLTSLFTLEERKGKTKPVIQKALVDLEGKPFLEFKKHREKWKLEDDYVYPGPIQFFGPEELTDSVSLSLSLS